ncbi:hypothetical protein M0805_009644 [Coniferiporia weirii]|nr:hypothetical protein M0805_009644 [Coniferiporia weirii]
MPSPMSSSAADGEHEYSSPLPPPYAGELAQHSDGGDFPHQARTVPVLGSGTQSLPRASTEISLGASPCPVPGSNETPAEDTQRGETERDGSKGYSPLSDSYAAEHTEFGDKTEAQDDLGVEATADVQLEDVRPSAERSREQLPSLPRDQGFVDDNSDPSESQLPLPSFMSPLGEAGNSSGTQYSSPDSSYTDLRLVTNSRDAGLSPFSFPSDRRRHSSANLSPTVASGADLLVPAHFPEQKRYSLFDSGPLPTATSSLDARRRTKSELGLSAGTPPLRRPRRARGLNGDGTESGSSSISGSRPSTARYSTFAEMGIQSFAMTKGEKTMDTKGGGKRKAEKTKRREIIVDNEQTEEMERRGETNETEQPKATEETRRAKHSKTLSKVKSRDCVIM